MQRLARRLQPPRRWLIATLLLPATALSGCLNWQAAYDEEARRECNALPDQGDRQACEARVDANSQQRRQNRGH